MSSSSSVPMPELPRTNEGKRICQVIKVKPEALEEYKKVSSISTLPLPMDDCHDLQGGHADFWQCHAAVWPEVLEALRSSHVVGQYHHDIFTDCEYASLEAESIDYSIHYLEPVNLLIAHMRYIGTDYEGDMAEIGKSEHTKKWWKVSHCS